MTFRAPSDPRPRVTKTALHAFVTSTASRYRAVAPPPTDRDSLSARRDGWSAWLEPQQNHLPARSVEPNSSQLHSRETSADAAIGTLPINSTPAGRIILTR